MPLTFEPLCVSFIRPPLGVPTYRSSGSQRCARSPPAARERSTPATQRPGQRAHVPHHPRGFGRTQALPGVVSGHRQGTRMVLYAHDASNCGNAVEDRFRFCPCVCRRPSARSSSSSSRRIPACPPDRGQRRCAISRIPLDNRGAAGAVFRFWIWEHDRAEAAVSLTDEEAARLATFVDPPCAPAPDSSTR